MSLHVFPAPGHCRIQDTACCPDPDMIKNDKDAERVSEEHLGCPSEAKKMWISRRRKNPPLSNEQVREAQRNRQRIREAEADPSVLSERIWSEPLTESERSIIELVMEQGDPKAMRRWMHFLLCHIDAREKSQ